jgi:hypothetical protein
VKLLFEQVDADHSNTVEESELRTLFQTLGFPSTAETMARDYMVTRCAAVVPVAVASLEQANGSS